ncbi:MAG: insulinase family protein [Candidatus Sungbacteria bacterium]|uniref:Insulinase family protein n=1 Tax=Candidatus Sungiibacteriota bacterium TaxID=2750080 RepID=A0A9D6LU95_9BACT|nr:insulinase family protein [Candidatus Sungbacteria bacterium]
MFKKTILPNKLRILTAPMQGTNTVTVLVMCETGSDNETGKESGISHFLEHMFFKGTKRRPTPQTIKHELDSMGSISNAFTSHEYTGYFIKAGHVYLDPALDLLADVYTNSLLDPKEINRERQVIIEEMHKYLDTPDRYVWDVYERLLYGDQNAGWEIIGTEKNIRTFTPEQFRGYFKNQYTAENTAVIVAGNFTEAKVIAKIKKLFGRVRASRPRSKGLFKESPKALGIKLHAKETDQSHILVGFKGLTISDRERYAAELLAAILGGSWSSRIWDRVRDRLGLAYTVHTSNDAYTNRGHLTTYAGVAHGNVEKAITAVMQEYGRITRSLVSARELARTKDYVRGISLIGLEASNAVASFIGVEEVLTHKPLTIDEVFAKIEKVSARDIQRVARRLFRPERLNLALIGPHKDEAKFRRLLKLE